MFIHQTSQNYRMKILIAAVVVIVVLATTFVASIGKDKRWLLMNGSDAEDYAIALLKNDASIETPNKFVDYTVNVVNGYVIFSNHIDHSAIYGYAPNNKEPSEIGGDIKWEFFDKNWFVSTPHK